MQVIPSLCSRSCQFPSGNQHCSRRLSAGLPLQEGPCGWLWAGQGKGTRELTISRATLKQWRIGVGGKQAQSLGPQWRALFCSISEDLRLPPLWEPTHYPIIPLSHDTPVLLLSHPLSLTGRPSIQVLATWSDFGETQTGTFFKPPFLHVSSGDNNAYLEELLGETAKIMD